MFWTERPVLTVIKTACLTHGTTTCTHRCPGSGSFGIYMCYQAFCYYWMSLGCHIVTERLCVQQQWGWVPATDTDQSSRGTRWQETGWGSQSGCVREQVRTSVPLFLCSFDDSLPPLWEQSLTKDQAALPRAVRVSYTIQPQVFLTLWLTSVCISVSVRVITVSYQ